LVRRLPIVPAPAAGESFASYIDQLSRRYQAPLGTVLTATGLCGYPPRPSELAGYGVYLTRARMSAFCSATGLDRTHVEAMLLRSYDGIAANFEPLKNEAVDGYLEVTRREWLLFRGSRLCPDCLVERDGAWNLSWKLPWSFACVQHKRLLIDRRPGCGMWAAEGRGASHGAPPFFGRVPEPFRCNNSPPPDRRPPGARGPCGHELLGTVTDCIASAPDLLEAQRAFTDIIETGEATVASQKVLAREYLSEARTLFALLLHFAAPDDLRPSPPTAARAFDDFVARREAAAANRLRLRRNGPHTVVYRRSQRDVGLAAAAAPTIHRYLGSSSTDELRERLRWLAEAIYERRGQRTGLRDQYGITARMEALLLDGMPSRRSRLWVRERTDNGRRMSTDELARRVPQVLWPDVWSERFAHQLPTNRDIEARRFLSMALVKYGSQCSWEQAAEALQCPDVSQGVFVGWVYRATRGGVAEQLRTQIATLFDALYQDQPWVDYGARRTAFRDLSGIEAEAWDAALLAAGVRDGRGRRYCAATWLWCELTGGYLPYAPPLASTPKRAREMYTRFTRNELPALRPALLDYGTKLLAAKGLAGGVEFRAP
jgi:TniQ